ncbi:arylsulfatase [Paenibacillus sp. 1P07SE]|uniref:arylsulfatase n=1 Tax=Paenibacillus sp. 1P07SE TaxID=3132209 RepID=UPI0039A53ABB
MNRKPNILLIMNDDMGYSDLGCYGGEVQTPTLDRLAQDGMRFTQFYNTPRCSPSRASLLTGLHPHQTGIGILTYDNGPEGYAGDLNDRCVTIAEVLKAQQYRTYMSGKWHVSKSLTEPSDSWPLQRGFDEFYGTIIGAGSFYHPNTLTRGNENIEHEAVEDDNFFYTDAISDQAARFIEEHAERHAEQPFFQYVAYTAPHWPLHAHEEDIAKYKGRFDKGWDKLREERLQRMIDAKLLDPSWSLTERDASVPAWEEAEDKEWLTRCMEVYAAQIDRMDQGIGRIVDALKRTGQLEDTLIIFLSDNGACAEDIPPDVKPEDLVNQLMIAQMNTRKGKPVQFGNFPHIMPGAEDTYQSYGTGWANLSNTPFRLYKHWTHEGGVSTPFIVHWPNGIQNPGSICTNEAHLPDVMATIVDITGTDYPEQYHGREILPMEGVSFDPLLKGQPMERPMFCTEHEGNASVRDGQWKLVKNYPGDWELYNMTADRSETNDLAGIYPERVKELSEAYERWAERCGVIPRGKILALMAESGKAFWEKE